MGWFWQEGQAPDTDGLRVRLRRKPGWWWWLCFVGAAVAFMIWLVAVGEPAQALIGVALLCYLAWLRWSPIRRSANRR
jgi:uncharacterized membrane protein YhaH (DUF805 family)